MAKKRKGKKKAKKSTARKGRKTCLKCKKVLRQRRRGRPRKRHESCQ